MYIEKNLDSLGTWRWYKNDRLHREGGPAVEFSNGSKVWYRNGRAHRDDGPAAEYNGSKLWYQYGELHREDGPAIEWLNGNKEWYKNGILYRLNEHEIYNGKCKNCGLKTTIYSEFYSFKNNDWMCVSGTVPNCLEEKMLKALL